MAIKPNEIKINLSAAEELWLKQTEAEIDEELKNNYVFAQYVITKNNGISIRAIKQLEKNYLDAGWNVFIWSYNDNNQIMTQSA